MIKNITLITGLLFVGLLITDLLTNQALTNNSGAPAGRTGSPGDGGTTCVSCHGGTATAQPGLITSNIPSGGYISGNTYTITAVIGDLTMTSNKFGFQVSPQNNAGNLLGTMVVTDAIQTQLVGSGKYITHTTAGTVGTSSTKTWSFDWIAPAPQTGAVTFYGAFNVANSDGTSSGDAIFTSTLTVQQDINSSINDMKKNDGILSVFPNPVSDNLSVSFKAESFTSENTMEILTIEGRLVRKITFANSNSVQNAQINLSDLNAGIYFLAIKNGEHIYMEKVIKK